MIYFFYGDEEFNISNEIKKLKSALDKDFIEMAYKEYNNPKFPDLISIISTLPLMFGKMLIVINCFDYLKGGKKGLKTDDEELENDVIEQDSSSGFDDKQLKQITEALDACNENLDIIFVAINSPDGKKKIDKRKKIFKILSKYNSKEFEQIPSYKTSELEAWIKNQAKLKDLKMESDAVSALLIQVGSNLRLLDSELEKLKVFANNSTVTVAMVKEICVNNEDLFSFIDNIISGKLADALIEYNKLLMTTYPLVILSTLQKMLKDKIHIKFLSLKYSAEDIAKIVNMHPYRVKLEMQKLKVTTLKNLINLKEKLTDAEYKIKTGQSNLGPERELEYAILQ